MEKILLFIFYPEHNTNINTFLMHQGPSTLRVFVNKLYYFSGKGHVVFWKCDYSIVFLISRRVRCITVFNALVRFNASTFTISSIYIVNILLLWKYAESTSNKDICLLFEEFVVVTQLMIFPF